MNRRNFMYSGAINIAGLGYIKLSNPTLAIELSEIDNISVLTESGDINHLKLNFSKFIVKSNNLINSTIDISIYSGLNENSLGIVDTTSITINTNNQDITSKLKDYNLLESNKLSESDLSLNDNTINKTRSITIKVEISNDNIKTQSIKESFNVDIHRTISNNLTHKWNLAGNAVDSIGNVNGNVSGASFITDTERGDVASFSENEDYIDVSGAQHSSYPVSISLWIKAKSDGRVYAESATNNSDNILSIDINSGRGGIYLRGQTGNAKICYGTKDLTNSWHHIVGIVTSDELLCYIDGELVNSTAHSRPFPNTNNASIGRLLYGGRSISYIQGEIHNIRTYDKKLNSDEVLNLYNITK